MILKSNTNSVVKLMIKSTLSNSRGKWQGVGVGYTHIEMYIEIMGS